MSVDSRRSFGRRKHSSPTIMNDWQLAVDQRRPASSPSWTMVRHVLRLSSSCCLWGSALDIAAGTAVLAAACQTLEIVSSGSAAAPIPAAQPMLREPPLPGVVDISPSKPKHIQPVTGGVVTASDGVSDCTATAGRPWRRILCCPTQASEGHSVEAFRSALLLG